jgi:endoglucanase
MKKLFFAVLSIAVATSMIHGQVPASASASSAPSPDYNPTGYFPGVNLSVAEFGNGSKLGTNYIYPNEKEFAYFQGKGFKIVRIPFKWERVQAQVLGDLDSENLKELDRCVSEANQHDLVVLLDLHNYGGRNVNGKNAFIGIDPELTNEQFNDFWVKLASHYKDNPFVWIGLMNEPHKQNAVLTAQTMQSAVNAIRGAGIKNRILVPGTSWTGAHSWIKSGNGAAYANFQDPGNNFAFEVHQYLDKDDSGTHPQAIPGKGQKCMEEFTTWAMGHHFKAFLGESGWDGNPSNTQANIEGDALLSSMDQNKDVWIGYTYWAAGPWWNKYMYSLEPAGLKEGAPVDRNQMTVLTKHLQ